MGERILPKAVNYKGLRYVLGQYEHVQLRNSGAATSRRVELGPARQGDLIEAGTTRSTGHDPEAQEEDQLLFDGRVAFTGPPGGYLPYVIDQATVQKVAVAAGPDARGTAYVALYRPDGPSIAP